MSSVTELDNADRVSHELDRLVMRTTGSNHHSFLFGLLIEGETPTVRTAAATLSHSETPGLTHTNRAWRCLPQLNP